MLQLVLKSRDPLWLFPPLFFVRNGKTTCRGSQPIKKATYLISDSI